jgi:ATP-dependent DNA helicase RecQ
LPTSISRPPLLISMPMKAADARKLQRSLKDVFGLEKLRPGQREVIEKVLSGRDVLAIMPTGGGKSLCYQLPGLHLDGMTVVVSPLISLMKDQSDKLEEMGLEAANLNSSISASEQREALDEVESEKSDFIFTTPERLTDDEFLGTISDKAVNLIVVDEAHCISQWGHDFRPAFLELRDAFHQMGDPPILALTATATPEVMDDIRKQLGRPRMEVVRGGIFRENLRFLVIHTTSDQEKRQELARLLRDTAGAKIVYCATVKAVDEVTKDLQTAGFAVESYTGKMTPKRRNAVQDAFMGGELETIVATNAFGMGVDKPDIRAVIHWQMPGSLEAYYQEAGRAGRDGEEADCILLYDTRDRRIQQFFLGGRYPTGDDVWKVYNTVQGICCQGGSAAALGDIQHALDSDVATSKVRVALNLLKDEKAVRERKGSRFELVGTPLHEQELLTLAERYVERGMSDREKLERMMLYAQSGFCRWKTLEKYFETDEGIENCGSCDNCVNPPEQRHEVAIPNARMTKHEETKLLKTMQMKKRGEIVPGDMVAIPKLGEAQVAEINGDKLTAIFPDGEEKIFKKSFVKKKA